MSNISKAMMAVVVVMVVSVCASVFARKGKERMNEKRGRKEREKLNLMENERVRKFADCQH